jgi:hypothetical protein
VAELMGSAAVVVALGAAAVVVDVAGVVRALVVVLAAVGAIVSVPLFVVEGALFRRVRS